MCALAERSVTLVAADPLEAQAAVTRPGHVVARGVVGALAQLLAAVTERPRRALWRRSRGWPNTGRRGENAPRPQRRTQTLTELAALPDEARPAGTLTADVVAVGAVLAAAHLGTVGAIEPGRAT